MTAEEVLGIFNKRFKNVTLAYEYKGSVADVADLPVNADAGDLYTVGRAQYVYDGTNWVLVAENVTTVVDGKICVTYKKEV